jgi:hypothetical protein
MENFDSEKMIKNILMNNLPSIWSFWSNDRQDDANDGKDSSKYEEG